MQTYDRPTDPVALASTPDPDSPPCEACGGGMAHYPECEYVMRSPSGHAGTYVGWDGREYEHADTDR